jgi:hypothetical protein
VEKITVRPRLLAGMNEITGRLVVHNRRIQLTVKRDAENQYASCDGEKLPLRDGTLEMDFPAKDVTLEIHIA